MDNNTSLQPEPDVAERFKDRAHPMHEGETRTLEPHTETSVEKRVRQTLFRRYLGGGLVAAVFVAIVFVAGYVVYRHITYIDPVVPDYSSLDKESDTYWTDRTLIDIETAQKSTGKEALRLLRIRTFAHRTANEAMEISSPYARAQAVTDVARALAQHDVNIVLDRQIQRLDKTPLIAAMRARTLVSQALMHLRQNRTDAAQVVMQQYNRLVIDGDLKLNSPINEEAFFGAVAVLWLLNDRDGLKDLFINQSASTSVLGYDQQMRAYRLIAGEQIRVGMASEALETARRIHNQIEIARAWALILQYSARPPLIRPIEPVMLDLLDGPQAEQPIEPVFVERVTDAIFHFLAEDKDINTQVALLRRIAGSRLMLDTELHRIFRHCLAESDVLDDHVKQLILKLLDDPDSPAIRTALNLPPRDDTGVRPIDPVVDDWTTTREIIQVEIVHIDSAPLRTRNDQQRVQALLAIVQGYQSIRRYEDADRVLKQAFIDAQRFTDSNVRLSLLLRIGEQQIAIGSIADAQRTIATVAPGLAQSQRSELARIQILARLFDDASETIASIELPTNREYVCTLLFQEQIRLNHLSDAEQTLSLMPQGRAAVEARSRLNIAKEQANRADFNALGLPFPEDSNTNWEQYCIGLIQQGLLRLADQATDRINNAQRHADVRTRITQEYLLLYRVFNDVNDPSRVVRQEIRQSILSMASRTSQPVQQTMILTELLTYLTGQLQTEEERTDGKQLWVQAMEACRKITTPGEKALWFARLIVAKNMLDNPDLTRVSLPLFTRVTHPSVFAENNRLVDECHELINSLDSAEQQGKAWVHLARALAQIGRTTSTQTLLDRILVIATGISDREESVSMLLSMVPVLRAMNFGDVIAIVYRLAIDKVAYDFSRSGARVDEFAWRMRDSDIEQIVRSQMESGFVDDAVESTIRLNEPLLRDRLLRVAAYFHLDNGNIDRAESIARRMTVRDVKDGVLQNIQIIKRRPR